MSRTRHHIGQKHRHRGHDLWSRRPLAGHGYSAANRLTSRRIERRSWEPALMRAELAELCQPTDYPSSTVQS